MLIALPLKPDRLAILATLAAFARPALAGAAVLLLSGCAFHPRGPHGPACPAIEAAAAVELPSERLAVLKKIATRPDLSQHEQTYLVNAVLFPDVGGSQSGPLIVLIRNPACTEETRQYIAKHLRFVAYSTDRVAVAEALGDAGLPGQPRRSASDEAFAEPPDGRPARAEDDLRYVPPDHFETDAPPKRR